MKRQLNDFKKGHCSYLDGNKSVIKISDAYQNISFDVYEVNDILGRRVRFYFSPLRKNKHKELPTAVFIQGSGCHSLFRKDEQGRILSGYQRLLQKIGEGRVNVLAVEKPGVSFLDWHSQSGSAVKCSQAFLEEHTLERWLTALHTVLHAVLNSLDVDKSRVLVLGHSEGGLVAACLANCCEKITHVGIISSSSISQVYEFILKKNHPKPAVVISERHTNERATNSIFETLDLIRQTPESTDDFAWGHPFRRWSSFLSTSTFEQLLSCKANIYVAHGTKDTVIPIESFDLMVSALQEKSVRLKVERLQNLDHGFRSENDKKTVGIERIMSKFLDWALD
jgi:pimeloyl-ACP methyl ester carboxylesterase